jgi:hypothetical protein
VDWFDLIWRPRSRVETTVLGVAASLAEAVVQSTNLLQTRLREEGFAWTDPARSDTDECLLECTILEWFLQDVVVSDGFGRRTEAIRRALGGRILTDLQRSGVRPACLADFDRRVHDRFGEYSSVLSASSSLQPLGELAWRRISGDDRPSERMTMLFAIRARAVLAGLIASSRAPVTGASVGRRSSTATPVREAPRSG